MTISGDEIIGTAVFRDSLLLPLVDFSTFLNGSEQDKLAAAKGIADGFKNAGFVYLKNHGIPKETVDTVFASSAEFFKRPQEQKDALSWTVPESNRGYVTQGRESLIDGSSLADAPSASIPDLRESMEIGREHGPPEYPNNWPDRFDAEGAEFRKVMTNFYDTCQELQMQVMRAIALGMGLEEKFFDRFVDAGDNNLRLLHYPATPASAFKAAPPKPRQVRASRHSDYGTVTLLFQDLRGGLEVRSPEGTWVGATPIEGTIVVNAGDLLSRWSNGAINSTEHQVVEPPSEPVDGWYPARYSCAYFCNPNDDAWIEALPGTYEKEEGKKFPGIIAKEYLVQRLSKSYKY